jgi:hypothetical protein
MGPRVARVRGGLLPAVWRSDVRFPVRAQATFHLTAYMIQLFLLALLLLYPFVVIAGQRFPGVSTVFGIGYLLAWTSIAPTVFFVTGASATGAGSFVIFRTSS